MPVRSMELNTAGLALAMERLDRLGGNTPTGTLTGNVDVGSFSGASELFVWALAANSGSGQSFNLTPSGAFSMSTAPPGMRLRSRV